MERYLKAESSFILRQYILHLLLAFLFCSLSGFFVSFRNLEAFQAAKVMEMYIAFTGIILLTPLFMPEQNKEIWLLKRSKAMPMWQLYLLRILTAVVLVAAVVTVFTQIMQRNGSDFSMRQLWIGSFAEILFLGSIGFFVSAVTNQVILGYMISILYFVVNIGSSRYLGKFALFQMLAASLLLLAAGVLLRERIR